DWTLSAEGRDEALQLQLERLSVGCVQFLPVDEGRNVRRAGPDLRWIEIVLESIVLAGARCEIERQILALLKDSDLSFSLARDTTRSDVGHRARGEGHL